MACSPDGRDDRDAEASDASSRVKERDAADETTADAQGEGGLATSDGGRVALDASNPADASLVQPAPMACDADASDDAYASYCPPPFSTCADGVNLAYFDWGTCVSGWCVWPQKIMRCPFTAACSNGACISTVTQSQ